MRIGIDIDGVLTNYYEAVIDNATKYFYENKVDYKIDQSKYYENEMFNVSDENIEKFWNLYLPEYAQNLPTRKFATEVISKLKQKHEIYIITARNDDGLPEELHGKMKNMVRNWLKDNAIEYDKLIFSIGSKLDICKQENVNIMIEDKASTIQEISKYIPVLCFDAPYNREADGENITRVYSWYDILRNIETIE